MSRIAVKPTTMAGDQIVQDTLSAANSQMPADKQALSADVERDADGKVTAVYLNFDADADQADLDNARSKIDENSGVATTSVFPISLTEDFESYTDGQDPGLVIDGLFQTQHSPVINTTSPLGGTKDLKIGANSGALRLEAAAQSMGFNNIKSTYTQFTVKDMNRILYGSGIGAYFWPVSTNWGVTLNGVTRDLGVTYDPSKEITFKISTSSSVWVVTMIVDGIEYTEIFTGGYPLGRTVYYFFNGEGLGAGQMDNIELKILDAL